MPAHDHRHGHDHDHDHSHAHGADHGGHGHVHAPADFGRAFAIGVVLNTGFVLIEAAYGLMANSTALLADAGHNLSDVLGLLVAWAAATASKRRPTQRFTYGLKSSSILAALFNALFLLVAIAAIGIEAIRRFAEPAPVSGGVVMIVAAIGIAVNGATALLFMKGGKSDINVRGAFLHMAADAVVSLGVVVAGLVILYTGWLWLDPTVSLAIAALIFWSTWGLLCDSVAMSLDAAPPNMPMEEVLAFLQACDGVVEVHDLHVWPMSTTETALTAHLVIPRGHPGDAFLRETCEALRRRFAIGHATLQVEIEGAGCPLAPAHVV
jgi:cobalt-zinc-cadmium efflux system protein